MKNYDTREDPYQNDANVEMWFSLNYGQLYKDIYRGITPLWKPIIQFCKCLKYTYFFVTEVSYIYYVVLREILLTIAEGRP